MNGDVISRQHAVAVEKQKSLAVCNADPVVADPCQPKAVVRTRGEREPIGSLGSPLGNKPLSLVGGPVIRNHDFEAALDADLSFDGVENKSEVPRFHERVHDQ